MSWSTSRRGRRTASRRRGGISPMSRGAGGGLARRRRGREVVVHASGSTVTDGRPGMLQRALSNLVENAAKFDRDGTAPIEISVSGFTWAGPVRVEVLDRGPGIADADLVRVFDRFYRAADARSVP